MTISFSLANIEFAFLIAYFTCMLAANDLCTRTSRSCWKSTFYNISPIENAAFYHIVLHLPCCCLNSLSLSLSPWSLFASSSLFAFPLSCISSVNLGIWSPLTNHQLRVEQLKPKHWSLWYPTLKKVQKNLVRKLLRLAGLSYKEGLARFLTWSTGNWK